jgi:hypothetical protein
MPIIDPQLVNIEIITLPGEREAGIRLNYQGQIYNLVRAFADHKREQAEQQLQQLVEANSNTAHRSILDCYLLVRETGYYSLWAIDLTLNILKSSNHADERLEVQQASIWLFQELWLQWQDLLGAKQLRVFAENLLTNTPQLESWADIDRLLSLDPLATAKLASWSELDFSTFDRQLYHLTQKKIGQQFGTKLTIDIIQAMPDSLRLVLVNILDI